MRIFFIIYFLLYNFCDFLMALSPEKSFLEKENVNRINRMRTSPNLDTFIERSRDRKFMNHSLQNHLPKSQLSQTLDILYTVDIAYFNTMHNTNIQNEESEESEEHFIIPIPNPNMKRRSPIQLPDGSVIPRAVTPQLQLDFEHAIVDADNGDITFPAFCIIPKDDD